MTHMRRRRIAGGWAIAVAALLVLATLGGPSAGAGSLWEDDGVSYFTQRKASQVGDAVTVIVVEEASASNQSQLRLSKENSTTLDGLGSGKLDFIPFFDASVGYTKEHQGKGQTSLSGSMKARVTATIIAVEPTGNLVIEGSRTVKINDDLDQITVRGIVRPEDIAADNTVLSTYLAEAQISYVGSGPGKNAGKQGILSRILDLIF